MGVVQFSPQMLYSVESYVGEIGVLLDALVELGDHPTRRQLHDCLQHKRIYGQNAMK